VSGAPCIRHRSNSTTRDRELLEEIAEVKLYLDALDEHDDRSDAEPKPQLS